ncbi:MAG TPA: hypothetical protein VFZ65_11685 [Planctomycetota bacterium]|nr:hypothetical protein [Planctomycetota bacterium]
MRSRTGCGTLLCAVGICGTVAAQQATPPPARASTTIEIVEPTARWFDRAKLARLVEQIVPMVEKYSELRFTKPPVVRAADDGTWIELVLAENPGARDKDLTVAITWGLYLPERDEVVLSPFLTDALMRAADGSNSERDAFARPMLAHELVHVLQEQHYQLPSRLQKTSAAWAKLMLGSLTEGHATWVEEQIGVGEFHYADYVQWSRKRHRAARRMAYLRGRDYVANLAAEGGMKAVHEALGGPVPTEREFARLALRKAGAAAPPEGPAGRAGKQ